jgi:cell division GTPase FtsZ
MPRGMTQVKFFNPLENEKKIMLIINGSNDITSTEITETFNRIQNSIDEENAKTTNSSRKSRLSV